jgi:zinc D-Ala-D-Ala carboxypeptidase
MKLTNNFSLAEMTKSQTATRKGIDNKPSTEHIENLIHLAETVLQPVREHFGKPVAISSGYRSPELCEAIGSSAKSQHAKGEAADFEIPGVDNMQLATWINKNTNFDQLILEYYEPGDPNSGWVHCSAVKEGSRAQVLKATKVGGKTKYENILLV